MELLIIKSNKDYFRIKDGKYLLCNLDKASVFPMEKLESVKQHFKEIRESGFPGAALFKLIMTEEPFQEPG